MRRTRVIKKKETRKFFFSWLRSHIYIFLKREVDHYKQNTHTLSSDFSQPQHLASSGNTVARSQLVGAGGAQPARGT